jgi:hypothetical protein
MIIRDIYVYHNLVSTSAGGKTKYEKGLMQQAKIKIAQDN